MLDSIEYQGYRSITHIVLVDLFVEVKLSHAVLVDFNHLSLALSVETIVSQREQILPGLHHISVRWQLHSGIALILLLLGLSRIEAQWLGIASRPSSSRAGGRTGRRLRRSSS